MDTGVGGGGVTLLSKYCVAEILAQILYLPILYVLVYVGEVFLFVYFDFLACLHLAIFGG